MDETNTKAEILAKLATVERENRELKEGWRQAHKAVFEETRERCAKVCEDHGYGDTDYGAGRSDCAEAIRALTQSAPQASPSVADSPQGAAVPVAHKVISRDPLGHGFERVTVEEVPAADGYGNDSEGWSKHPEHWANQEQAGEMAVRLAQEAERAEALRLEAELAGMEWVAQWLEGFSQTHFLVTSIRAEIARRRAK